MNPTFQIPHHSSCVLHQEERWFTLASPRLLRTERRDHQEQISSLSHLRTHLPALQSQVLHKT